MRYLFYDRYALLLSEAAHRIIINEKKTFNHTQNILSGDDAYHLNRHFVSKSKIVLGDAWHQSTRRTRLLNRKVRYSSHDRLCSSITCPLENRHTRNVLTPFSWYFRKISSISLESRLFPLPVNMVSVSFAA